MLLARSVIIAALLMVGCATTPKNVRILSDPPGAEVSFISPDGETKALGLTPYDYTRQQIDLQPGNVFGFKFHKEGYEIERVYVSNPTKDLHGELRVKLSPSANWNQAFDDKTATKYLEDVAKLTAEIQGAIAAKDMTTGEQKARWMTTRYPDLAVGWSLLGNVLYLQNRKSEALDAYNKALGLDPTNQETRNVINQIRGT